MSTTTEYAGVAGPEAGVAELTASLRALAYWRAQASRLAEAARGVEIPDGAWVQPCGEPAACRVRVDAATAARVRTLASGSDFLVYTILHACAAALVARYTGRRTVVVGSPRRLAAGTEAMPGVLPVISSVEVGWSVKRLLAATRDGLTNVFGHQSISDTRIAGALSADGTSTVDPASLTNVVVALDSIHGNAPADSIAGTVRLDFSMDANGLTLRASLGQEGVVGERLESLVDRYLDLLGEMTRGLDTALRTLSFLSARELCGRETALEFNASGAFLHQRFEAHAERTPDAVAVIFEDEVLTYGDLDAQADRLAARLRAQGVRPDSFVAVYLERSADVVVAFLGVLKAGGVYVPIDPAYPAARSNAMLADIAACVVLTQERLLDQLTGVDAPVVCIEAACEADPGASLARDVPALRAEHLAYCIFTSGTTGRPKAAMLSHAALADHAVACAAMFGMVASDRAILFSSISFDVSVEQMATALCSGASLVVRGPALWSPSEVVERIVRHGITVANIPTAYWHVFGADGHEALASLPLRLLVMGGEAALADAARRSILRCRVINAYGPSEAAVSPCLLEVRLGTKANVSGQYLALGEPLPNTHAYVLGENLVPRAPRWSGEIYLAGVRLARGYLNNPALTAERFIPNPYGPPGSRMYRTGDFGRRNADGSIEFLGRTDQQVKIRGHRVETGEVESALLRCTCISEAIVVARQSASGDTSLVAYVVAEGRAADAQSLRSQLAQRLPDFMLPADWVFLESLPLDPNGKVDRKSLPAPDDARGKGTAAGVEAANELERTIADIWAQALQMPRVGVDDDFFALGGHSLMAAKVAFQIARRTGRDVKIAAVFAHPSVRSLAVFLEQTTAGDSASRPALARQEGRLLAASDAILDVRIVPPADLQASCPPWRHVLLTGATGFVGRYLAAEILERTPAVLHVLARSASPSEAAARIRDCLRSIGRWRDGWQERIVVLAGDLSRPDLGLDASERVRLGGEIEHIVHAGAEVNFVARYEALRGINVKATEALIRLASEHKLKSLHYISSLHESRGSGVGGALGDGDRLPSEPPVGTGYVVSKWAAERLVEQATARGMPCSIYRLGLVTADAGGRCNQTDLLYLMVHALGALGLEAASDHAFHSTPADSAANAIMRLALTSEGVGETLHIGGDQALSVHRFAKLLRRQGGSIESVDDAHWLEALRKAAERTSDPRLAALYTVCEQGLLRTPPATSAPTPSSLAPNTAARLSRLDFRYPHVDDANLEATIRFLSGGSQGAGSLRY